MTAKTRYVAGFLYDTDYKEVALIQKTKPEWQKGKLNGIGGKIENGETPLQAMVREFEEEAGIHIETWREFCVLSGEGYQVHFFEATGDLTKLKCDEEEKGQIHWVVDMGKLNTIPNLRWLVPLGCDKDKVGGHIYEFYSSHPLAP